MGDVRSTCSWSAWTILGSLLVAAMAITFLPLFPCNYCDRYRQEIYDWLDEPRTQTYQKEHPEATAQARADLRAIEERCSACFHGRIKFWDTLFRSQ